MAMKFRAHETFFIRKGWLTAELDEAVAAEDACRIEHVISAESFEAIKEHARMYAK